MRNSKHAGAYAAICAAAVLLSAPICASAADAKAGPHASAVSTSRWWKLACEDADRCTLTVKLRGAIDASSLELLRHALKRRADARNALQREVALRIDLDSPGGELFSALEIGRVLRAERASVRVRDGASCVSACVFVLMGATERDLDGGARVAIHRPSLDDPKPTGGDAIVEAMSAQLVAYAQQMNVPRRIIDDMMRIPADQLRWLRPSELAAYGVVAADSPRGD
jgi:ATP-dependent protease ClpP protease subunit